MALTEQDMMVMAKGVGLVLRPKLAEVAKESADHLDLIQDLQDRVAKLEALVASLVPSE